MHQLRFSSFSLGWQCHTPFSEYNVVYSVNAARHYFEGVKLGIIGYRKKKRIDKTKSGYCHPDHAFFIYFFLSKDSFYC